MMNYNFDLTGKVIAITGGAGVICSTLAKALAAKGAKIAVLDLFLDKAEELAQSINKGGGDAIGVMIDVLNKESIQKACDVVLAKYGTVDILINGAGGNKPQATTNNDQTFFDIPQDALNWVTNLNLLGSIMPSQVFGKVMADKKKGSIINVSSMSAFRPLTKVLAYGNAKAAINNFTQWLAVYLNMEYSKDIRVNAIAPGFLLTEQNRFLLTDKETGEMTERGKKIIDHTPMGRYGTPEDLAGAVIFLCSDEASFINGVIIPIDGGFDAYSGV